MKNPILFSVFLLTTSILFSTPAFAQKKHRVVKNKHKKTHIVHNNRTNTTRVVKHTAPKTRVVKTTKVVKPVVVGARIKTLPVGYKRIAVGNARYYHHLGNYYQWNSGLGTYVVVRPPIGTVISTIPAGYRMMNYNGVSHYVLNGVYYRPHFRNGARVFVVARV